MSNEGPGSIVWYLARMFDVAEEMEMAKMLARSEPDEMVKRLDNAKKIIEKMIEMRKRQAKRE